MNKEVSILRSEIQASDVYLPDQNPGPFELGKIPIELLQHSAIEELIGQNKDLLARLNVNLRRNGELEQRLQKALEHKQGILKLNEKLSDSKLEYAEKNEILNNEIKVLKQKLEDFYSFYKQQCHIKNEEEVSFREQFHLVQNKLQALEKYRNKIKLQIHPLFKELRFENKKLTIAIENFENREVELKELIRQLSVKIRKQEIDFRNDLVDRDLQLEQTEKSLNKEIQQLKASRHLLTNELQKHKRQAQSLQGLEKQISQAENRAISAERERFNAEKVFSQKLQELQEQIAKLKNEQAKNQHYSKFYDEKSKNLVDENSSLQSSVAELTAKLEKLTTQNKILQTENEELKYKEKSARTLYKENLQKSQRLSVENENLHKEVKRLTPPAKIPSSPPPQKQPPTNKTPQLKEATDELSQVDKLIFEIEKHTFI